MMETYLIAQLRELVSIDTQQSIRQINTKLIRTYMPTPKIVSDYL